MSMMTIFLANIAFTYFIFIDNTVNKYNIDNTDKKVQKIQF